MGKIVLALGIALMVFGLFDYARGVVGAEIVVASGGEVVNVAPEANVYDPDPNRVGYFVYTGTGDYAGWAFMGSTSAGDEEWHLLMAVHHPNNLGGEVLRAMGEALMFTWHGGGVEMTEGVQTLVLRDHGSEVVSLKV